MKIVKFLTVLLLMCLLPLQYVLAEEKSKVKSFQDLCKKDLDFVRLQLQKNSAPYANKTDQHFHKWYKDGYEYSLKLINGIGDKDDCHYVMKYFINGFDQSHISIRGYIPLPTEMYPGIMSAKNGDGHYIFYKHPALEYLKNVSVGDRVTHINDIKIEEYDADYLRPFYANDDSELTLVSASVYALIIDGNRFKPDPKTVTIIHDNKPTTIELKYTELSGNALVSVKKLRQPEVNESFKVEMVSNGVWIKIPSFFPTRKESVYFTGMLSVLKKDLAKEDYILFDMRGNRGGAIKWSVPIIRNLWGDNYIKSLGEHHDYNKQWIKKLRVSKENFGEFQTIYGPVASKAYAAALKKGDDFFIKKWSIYEDEENLYTNDDSAPFNAKVYVLTDSFCRSTCWNFVKELEQIPGVVHLGGSTAVQGIYSYAKKDRTPSEHFDVFYPTQIRIKPESKLGEALVPLHVYEGNSKDEAKVLDWVLSIIEKDLF